MASMKAEEVVGVVVGFIVVVGILKGTLPTLFSGVDNITAGGAPILDTAFPYLLLAGVIGLVFWAVRHQTGKK